MDHYDSVSDSDSDFQSCLSSSDSSYDSYPGLTPLQEVVETHFSGFPRNFNVVHINAQSIPAHFPDMLASFNQNNLHAIMVSESWLKPCLASISYTLPGFRLIRNDRIGAGGGGVAIYLRSHLAYTILSASSQPPTLDNGEHLFIEVELAHTKILLGVFYASSLRVNYFSSFENLLEYFSPSYTHTIIMGDFNTCLLKRDHRSSSLETLTRALNLNILPLSATHHFPNSTPSLLDLIMVSSLSHVSNYGQCSADAFSYHDLIFL